MSPCWSTVSSKVIEQGDLLLGCEMPRLTSAAFDPAVSTPEFFLERIDAIVLTQSCQLEQGKLKDVVVCRVATVTQFNHAHGDKFGKDFWSNVRSGRDDRLHLLHPTSGSSTFSDLLVVDFREIFTPPLAYLQTFATGKDRSRLQSPHLEHLAQRFGYYFMKVALPTDLPKHP
jgi:hypothetical protein